MTGGGERDAVGLGTSASGGRSRASRRDRALDLALAVLLLLFGPLLLLTGAPRHDPSPMPPAGASGAAETVEPAHTADATGAGHVSGEMTVSTPADSVPAAAAVKELPVDPSRFRPRGSDDDAPPIVFVPPTPTPAPTAAAPSLPVVNPPWDPGPKVTVLLLGVDARLGSDELSRTDTMIVATVDPRNRTAAMLSIPRDLWVRIPDATAGAGMYEDRINVAYFLGQRYHYPGGGAALAKRTVEQNFGIQIDYTARVDFVGFERAIDTLGGITVDVPKVLADTSYPTDDYGTMSVYFPPGRQRMDGHLALIYARSRHGDNDLERARRQQSVLLSARDEALSVGMVAKLPLLLGVLRDSVATDMPFGDIVRLGRAATEIDRSRIVSRAFDASMCYGVRTNLGADILVPRWTAIKSVVDDMFGPSRRVGNPSAAGEEKRS